MLFTYHGTEQDIIIPNNNKEVAHLLVQQCHDFARAKSHPAPRLHSISHQHLIYPTLFALITSTQPHTYPQPQTHHTPTQYNTNPSAHIPNPPYTSQTSLKLKAPHLLPDIHHPRKPVCAELVLWRMKSVFHLALGSASERRRGAIAPTLAFRCSRSSGQKV